MAATRAARGASQRHRSEPARGDRAGRELRSRRRGERQRGRPHTDRSPRREAPPASARECPSQPCTDAPHRSRRGARCVHHGTSALPLARALRRTLPPCDVTAGDRAIPPSGASRTRPRRPRRRRVSPGDRPSRERDSLVWGRGRPDLRAALLRLGARRASPRLAPARTRRRLLLEGARREARPAALSPRPRGARVRAGAAVAEELRRRGASPCVPDLPIRVACGDRGGVAAARTARNPARRAPDAHRDRAIVRRPGAQARPLAAAVSRAAAGDARRAALHRPACPRALGHPQAADPHERAPRQPLPACPAARECERGSYVLDPHDRLRVRHRALVFELPGRRRPSNSSSIASSPRTRSRTSGRRARSTSRWPRMPRGSLPSSRVPAEPIR